MESVGRQFVVGWTQGKDILCPCQTSSSIPTQSRSSCRKVDWMGGNFPVRGVRLKETLFSTGRRRISCRRLADCEPAREMMMISFGPDSQLFSRVDTADIVSLQKLAAPSSQCGRNSACRFFRFACRSSAKQQLNTSSSDEFSKPSTTRRSSSSSSPAARSSALPKPDSNLVGAPQSQSAGKASSSTAVSEERNFSNSTRSNSLENAAAVLSKSKSSDSSEDQRVLDNPNEAISELSQSSSRRTTSRPSLDFLDDLSKTSPSPAKLVDTPPRSRQQQQPYFNASNASYKAQVLLGASKSSSQRAAAADDSSARSRSSSAGFPLSTHRKNAGTVIQGPSSSLSKIKPSSSSFTLSKNSVRNPEPSEVSNSMNFPSRYRLSGSASNSASSASRLSPEMAELQTTSLASNERVPQRVVSPGRSPTRSTRKDHGGKTLPSSSSESLDRLHHQLEEQARGNSSKAILQKPLGPEESERLRARLKEQKQKSIKEIHRRLFRQRKPIDGQEDEFSCAVEPDSLILGEYVVHKRVGVGKYIGMKGEVPPGKSNPSMYIYLKYADGVAKLKAKQAHRLLYRYHLPGEIGGTPSLSKLKDPSLWEKRKNKGKIAIQKMVVNMMELYIHRLKQSRPPYPKKATAIAKFAAKFPYTPTKDQLQAFADVERDMTTVDLPMDRLICGDVGFGKTEVALRAIFIAVEAGKQVMVLTPSTVLAKQHYETIRDRFASFPGVKVALLCRFQKESMRKDIIVGIHDGSLNIVVGTHSLLGSQIRYHNLGLLVIDEEQRFGVKQKEKITCLKTSVDVLTLSATPIPRTLYLAMSGFRDASLLTTPPPERRPIQTHLVEYNEGQARKAIQFELDRGGQVFYVVPKVKGIDKLQQTLQSQFPDVKVAIAHGKQSAAALEEAMQKFCEGETRILLCTNIIESGLDIRMVNTIIVEDVHHFGLAQLYQLRGRVGRAQREAHAYLFHPHKALLTDEALERLVALQDCCDLGQGFQLAERDMAIRGIGSLFGEQQSGDAAKIGTDLYFEMLLEGLSKVDSQRLPPVQYDDVQLELGVDTHIPSDYIKSPEEREAAVRGAEHAARESLHTLMLSTNRLRDKYGREPASMEMLLKTIYVRRMAADVGIHRIRMQGTSILMETNMSIEAFDMITASISSDSIRSSLTFESGCIEIQGLIGLPPERQMERIFSCLADMFSCLPSFVKYI